MARVQLSVGSCPIDGRSPRLSHHGEATACRADPPTSIPGLVTGITVHDHCPGQGLPELLSETEIAPCNYQREGTTFVDLIENYLSRRPLPGPFYGEQSCDIVGITSTMSCDIVLRKTNLLYDLYDITHSYFL